MFKEKLALVPHKPGCYLMKDENDIVIYVGKSKNLKNRLTSYFRGKHTGKTAKLVEDIDHFEYIVTNTEMESLLLEINLIKKYDPKYNILLRDDKTYPYIELTNDKVPRLIIVRNPNMIKKRDLHLFGPFPNVVAARKTVELINRVYPLRKCKNFEKKECLYYHIGECLGYCVHDIKKEEIDQMKNEIISFLNGNHEIITKKLEEKMLSFSEKMEYEKALEYKELVDYITITLEKQKVELGDNYDRDIVGYYYQDGYLSIQILFIRGGKLLDRYSNIFPIVDDPSEELLTFMIRFYDKHKIKQKEIFVPSLVDTKLLSETLERKVFTPQKGLKKKILDMACENAQVAFHEKMELIRKDEDKTIGAMKELSTLLGKEKISRIELFDNSNLFGTFNVSGMVVFIDGKPAKNEYRKFKITSSQKDDYHTMQEVIYRRYFRVLKEKLTKPDLIIVDGGVGQIHAAREVLEELNLDILVCGLKKNEKHNTAELLGDAPIRIYHMDKNSNLFLLLTRMQDEVHNYTIHYHKQIRSKGAMESVLDNIEGIGETRKYRLLKKYKTISKLKEASLEELEEILPQNTALLLQEFLKNY